MPAPTPFTFRPDASVPVLERWEWLTDVSRAADGTESRRPLRKVPRCTITYQVTAGPDLPLALASGYAGAWYVPLPHHAVPATSWAGCACEHEAHVPPFPATLTINAVGTPPAGDVGYICPAPRARLLSARADGVAYPAMPWDPPDGGLETWTLTWLLEEPPLTLPAPLPFLAMPANWANSVPSRGLNREAAVLDNGRVRLEDALFSVVRTETTASWTVKGALLYSTLALLHATAGRAGYILAMTTGTGGAYGYLADDAVELSYIAPGFADMSLTIEGAPD